MSRSRNNVLPDRPDDALGDWRIAWWLILMGGTVALLPMCLDYSLAPRFFFLSAALAASFYLLWPDLKNRADWAFRGFDVLLLGWYGLNLVSVSWAFSWSEGVFYAQKTLLLFLVYWLARQALLRDEQAMRRILATIVRVITWGVGSMVAAQVLYGILQHGFDNEALYGTVSGLYGNKSLTTEFLFFLLIFNVLLHREQSRRLVFWLAVGLLGALMVVLQTRSVYLALAVCLPLYGFGRAAFDPGFRSFFWKRILPIALVLVAAGAALVLWKGRGDSLAQRLNPLTYLDSDSANERRFVWYKTGLLNREHFWLGVGDGSWKFWFPSKNIDGGYRMEEQNVVFTRVHNDYLEVQAEMGIVGVVWFCVLFLCAFGMAVQALRRKGIPAEQAVHFRHDVLVAGLGLLGYCIIQFFDFPRERIDLQVVLALLFGWITWSAGKYASGGLALEGVGRRLMPVLAVGGLLFCLVIGWYRIRGEIHNVRLADAQVQQNWRKLIEESQAAENIFYQYTDVALPLAWHEGIGWYQLDKTDQALTAFEKAYRLNPWSFQVLNNYASTLVRSGQFRNAIPLYEQVWRINPSFDDSKLNLSYAYLRLGEYTKSLEWLDRVDTIANPGNETDREANRRVKARQAEFKKAVLEKMK